MRFFSLDVLYAPRLPDLYFWWKSCVLYSRFYGTSPCTQYVNVGTSPCTQYVNVRTSPCTQYVGTSLCTQYVIVGTSPCTQYVNVGTSPCTQHIKYGYFSVILLIRSSCTCWNYLDTRFTPNLKPTTCKCIHLVIMHGIGHFQSLDKDGGHTIRSATAVNAAGKVHGLCFIEPELLMIEVLHCGSKYFGPVLLLWPWPWPINLHIQTWPVFLWDVPHAQKWTSYFKAIKCYCLTDRQTDRQNWNWIPQ